MSDASDSGIGLSVGGGGVSSSNKFNVSESLSDYDPDEMERPGVLNYMHTPSAKSGGRIVMESTVVSSSSQGRIVKHKPYDSDDGEWDIGTPASTSSRVSSGSASRATHAWTADKRRDSDDGITTPLLSGKRDFQRTYNEYKNKDSTAIEMVHISQVSRSS